jgi:hypothetical protein
VPTAEQIEAVAKGASLFQGIELFLILAALVGIVYIIFVRPKPSIKNKEEKTDAGDKNNFAKSKKAIQEQDWVQSLREGIDAVLKENRDALRVLEKEVLTRVKTIETMLESDACERKKSRDEVNYRLDKQYEFIREAALKSCVAIIWGDQVPLIEFLDAVFLSFNLGANGNTIDRVSGVLKQDKDRVPIYRSELAKFKIERKAGISDHFNKSVEALEREIC